MVKRNGKEINTSYDRTYPMSFLKVLEELCNKIETLSKMATNVDKVLTQYKKTGRISEKGGNIIDAFVKKVKGLKDNL